jgi:hypothetical protein
LQLSAAKCHAPYIFTRYDKVTWGKSRVSLPPEILQCKIAGLMRFICLPYFMEYALMLRCNV